MGDEPVIYLRSNIDQTNYLALMDSARRAYEQDLHQLTLDLRDCTKVNLSALFALHSIHTIYRGSIPADSENGWRGLNQMAADNRCHGSLETIHYQNIVVEVEDELKQNFLL